MLVMVTVMIQTTVKIATMIMGTVVDPMLIQHIALNVNALVKEDQREEKEMKVAGAGGRL